MEKHLRFGLYGHGVPFSGHTLREKSLGGSETMYVQLSEALARRGHQVTVMTLGGSDGAYNGVEYLDYTKHRDYLLGHLEYDVFLVGRDYSKLSINVRSKMNVLWNHDILSDGKTLLEHLYATDMVLCLSNYHTQLYLKKAPELAPILSTTRNGIDPRLMNQAKEGLTNPKRMPHTFVYGSRPERGLLYLLKTVWPKITERIPEAVLYVAGYDVLPEMLPEHVKRIHQGCSQLMKESKNVIQVGNLKKEDWYKLLLTCQTMLYPTDFQEISCLAAIEAQACGMTVLTTHDYALPECVLDKRNLIDGKPWEDGYVEKFVERAVQIDTSFSWVGETHTREMIESNIRDKYDIDKLAEDWEHMLWEHFIHRAMRKPSSILRQFLYNSDLLAAKYILEESGIPIEEDVSPLKEMVNNFLTVQHSEPDLYANYMGDKIPNLTHLPSRMALAIRLFSADIDRRKQEYEQPPKDLRPQGINTRLLSPQDKPTPQLPRLRLLDIGCGEGRFLFNAVKMLEDTIIPYGIDFSPSLIQHTREALLQAGLAEAAANLEATDLENFQSSETFDLLFVGEWLEHQQDIPHALDMIFRKLSHAGSLIIFTVPSGPWESLSYGTTFTADKHEVRFHVSHFELRDILDLFGHMPHQLLYDPVGVAPTDGQLLGNWVVAVWNDGKKVGTIDYVRKFYLSRPYQYISAAIICKNEEDNILKMIKSIERHVDEIILYDTGSTDQTLSLMKDRRKVKIIEAQWPGDFSKARNASIQFISTFTDWVYWMDVDECLVYGSRLHKYVHSRLYNGFIILQHHFMLDVPNPTPDVPVRLFRNGYGYQWYGKVHEQVQSGLNEPISPVLILPDVHIAHFGYLTEQERRAKVQTRNLDLLIEDRQENPDRQLGAVLLMRDLLHFVNWTQEARNSTAIDDTMLKHLWNVISLYEPFKDWQHLYHLQAWGHYQDALKRLANAGLVTQKGLSPQSIFVKLDGDPKAPPATIWFQDLQELEDILSYKLSLMKNTSIL